MRSAGQCLLGAALLGIISGTAYANCDGYPWTAGEAQAEVLADGIKILATGQAAIEIDDVTEVQDALREAELAAKAVIARFFNETIQSDERVAEFTRKNVKLDAAGRAADIEKTKATLRTMSSSSSALLRGVIKLSECVTKGRVAMVTVGLKPETVRAAESGTRMVHGAGGAGTASEAGSGSGAHRTVDGYSKGVEKAKTF